MAVLFSLIIPGLGQFYAGKARRGIVIFICGYIVGNIAMVFLIFLDSAPLNVILCVLSLFVFFMFNLIDAWRQARKVGEPVVLMPYNRWYVYVGIIIISIIFEFATEDVNFLGVQPNPIFGDYKSYKVPSSAMEEALLIGDFFLADKAAYSGNDPQRNDIIAFLAPLDNSTIYVKRCIGLPGDTIEVIDKVLYINGIQASEPPTVKHTDPRIQSNDLTPRDNFGPYVVYPNHYFVMGDNRDNSHDSRFWGAVSRELILGKAVRIYYSEYDWNRIGMTIQ